MMAISPDEMRRRMHQIHERARQGQPMSREDALARANQEGDPRTAAMKHGGYAAGIRICTEDCPAFIARRCDECDPGQDCPLEAARHAQMLEVYRRLVADDGLLPLDAVMPLIADVVLRMIRLERLQMWAAIMPEVTPLNAARGEFEIQPGHRDIDRFAQAWERGLDQLGLSRRARLELDAERQQNSVNGLAAIIMNAQAQIKGPGEAVDAEFEDGDPRPLGGTGGDGEPHP